MILYDSIWQIVYGIVYTELHEYVLIQVGSLELVCVLNDMLIMRWWYDSVYE